MKCLICENQMHYSFSKWFKQPLLEEVEYWKCQNCGFVASKTHLEMSDGKWERINVDFHGSYHGTEACPEDLQWVQRLHTQAAVIADLNRLGLLPSEPGWVDFGCGDGKLSGILFQEHGLKLQKFDRYEENAEYLTDSEIMKARFGFVVTTSVFEHLRSRQALDDIESLVGKDGVMGLHTLVAEEVPSSPEWFYLLPVHCAFYTNKSMQLLFEQWRYTASIYHVDSRLWFWFKSGAEKVERIINEANAAAGRERFYYHFKYGFMDYWKLESNKIINRK